MPAPLHLREHIPSSPDDLQGRLNQAVGMNRPDEVQALLAAGADVNAPGPVETPLQVAVGVHNIPMIERLVANGADLNAPRPNGEPPVLIAAIRKSLVPVVVRLLELGADPMAADGYGTLAMECAMYRPKGAVGAMKAVLAAHAHTGTSPSPEQWGMMIEHQVGRGQHALLALFAQARVPALPTAQQERVEETWRDLCPRPHRRKVRAILDRLHVVAEQAALREIMDDVGTATRLTTGSAPEPAGRRRL